MKNPQKPLKESRILRKKAEEQLKKKLLDPGSELLEVDNLKIIHELQVHQIELEIQNEALVQAKVEADVAAEKYIELYDFAPSGYFTLSNEGKITELNLNAASMLGKERQRLINTSFGLFISHETKQIFNNFLSKVFEGKKEESCEITISKVDDKQPLYVFLAGHVCENSRECFITMIDISIGRKAELALEENERKLFNLNADKDRFISILSHDLRSPFNVLLGLSDILTKEIRTLNIDKIENIAKDINITTQRTYNLLEDILLWARAQQGKIPFEPKKTEIADIVKPVIDLLKPNADAKNITVNYLTEDRIHIYADVDMLKTILRNLVSNAIKFTNKNGEININAKENSSDVTISVSDNGVGIVPDKLAKLFDISKVVTTKGTADETGTGLGLLLCKEFIEKHRGKLWAVSEFEKGSTFKFSLPF